MDRYSEVTNKNQREIVLLKAFPCKWGKCSFCDYILDNSKEEEEINKLNFEVLENITGKYKVLEVINSGSCFEMPKATLLRIKEIIKEKGIENITDDTEIRNIIKEVIISNEESVTDYKNGHDRAIKFLMGQVMKMTKGKANPKMAMDILIEELQ